MYIRQIKEERRVKKEPEIQYVKEITMHYTNNGYFCIPKENEEEFLEKADEKGFGENLVFSCESKGKPMQLSKTFG